MMEKEQSPIQLTDHYARARIEADRVKWRNKVTYHLYIPLIFKAHDAGIDIPEIYFEEPTDIFQYKTLSDQGAVWVKRQLWIYRRTQIKEWVTLLGPIVSVVISVLALVISIWRTK